MRGSRSEEGGSLSSDAELDAVRQQAIARADPPIIGRTSTRTDAPVRVGIVIPAHCEQESLSSVLRAMPDLGPGFERRVFVVDDGSTDATARIAREEGATLVRHEVNFGIGAALTTGFMAARVWGADVIVQLDADGQHDPTLIPALIAPILRGEADYVLGSRFRSDSSGFPNLRRVGVMIYTRLVRVLSGYDLTDVTSGYRAFRASVYPRLSFRAQKNWAIEMTLRAGLNGVSMREVSTPHRLRCGGHSQFDRSRLFLQYHGRALLQITRAYTSRLVPPGRWSPPTPFRIPRPLGGSRSDLHDAPARASGDRGVTEH
jgi:glycosyltransferase involved in cell wall biosynthesis